MKLAIFISVRSTVKARYPAMCGSLPASAMLSTADHLLVTVNSNAGFPGTKRAREDLVVLHIEVRNESRQPHRRIPVKSDAVAVYLHRDGLSRSACILC